MNTSNLKEDSQENLKTKREDLMSLEEKRADDTEEVHGSLESNGYNKQASELEESKVLEDSVKLHAAKQSAEIESLNEKMEKVSFCSEEETNAKAEVDKCLEDAVHISTSTVNMSNLLDNLKKASNLAAKYFTSEGALKVFESCSGILEDFFEDLQYFCACEDAVNSNLLSTIDLLISITMNTENLKNKRSLAIVCTRYYLCSCALQHSSKLFHKARESADKAINLLKENFGHKTRKMLLYGRVCFYKGRCFDLKNNQECNVFLKDGIDALYNANTISTDVSTMSNLYFGIYYIINQNSSVLKKEFGKKLLSKIMARSESILTESEDLLNILTLILLSKAFGKKELCKRKLNALEAISFCSPPCKLNTTLVSLILAVYSHDLISDNFELKKKLANFAKDLSLSNRKECKKLYLLNCLALTVVFREEELFSNSSYFHLPIVRTFVSELDKVKMVSSCAWMHRRLCSSSVCLSYLYVRSSKYGESIEEADKVFLHASLYDGPTDTYIELAKADAHYIMAFVFFDFGQMQRAKNHAEEEVKVLEAIQPQFSERLEDARKTVTFLQNLQTNASLSYDVPQRFLILFLMHHPQIED